MKSYMEGRYDQALIRRVCQSHGVPVCLAGCVGLFFTTSDVNWWVTLGSAILLFLGVIMLDIGLKKEEL